MYSLEVDTEKLLSSLKTLNGNKSERTNKLIMFREVVRYNTSDKDLQNAYYFTEKEPESELDGKYQAIRVKFNLPKSAYATMCVRELTKNSTSFAHQVKLNQMAK